MADATSVALGSERASLDSRRLAVGGGVALAVAGLGFAHGGYYPTAWGWAALVALWFAATYAVVGAPARPGILALAFLSGVVLVAAWTWLSLAWTADFDQTVLEGQRTVLYVALLVAFVLVARRGLVTALLAGLLIGIFLPAGYGLLTRLFPDRIGAFDAIAGYRLSEPLGYWNALGIFAAMGVALALGFAARGSLPVRVLAAGAVPPLLATTYFTFGRGPWIALGVGLLALLAVDPRRLQALIVIAVLAGPGALAVLLASRQDALTRTDALEEAAAREGHRLALYLLGLSAAAAVLAAGFALLERRVRPPRTVRLAFAGALVAAVVLFFGALFVREGGPITLVDRTWDSFAARPPPNEADLRERLTTFSGSYRVDLWRAALDDYADNRIAGGGAGTYEAYWTQHRPFAHRVRDAHSLYLETLDELGFVGLLLLALALGVPLVAAVFARGHPLVPAALAAYVAYLVHSGVDWDWELPAVTVVALACGAALTAAAAGEERRPLADGVRWATASAAVVLAAVAFVGLIGASALSASDAALARGRSAEAADEARKARRWWRWSPEPWSRLGDAQFAAGNRAAAAASYRRALAKDRRDWKLWYDLASAAEGAESRRAFAETRRLNPFYESDVEERPLRAAR